MFTKVLIANRGAIAVRIERTLKKMGVGSVAVYAQADQDSLHVKNADEAVCLGEGTVSETYLSIEKILAAAKETGAEAVHPGYGFLSENTDFAAACEQAGIVFIGPTAAEIRRFGLKHAARARGSLWRAAAAGHGASLGGGRGRAGGGQHRLSRHAEEHGGRRRHRHPHLPERAGTSRGL